MVLNYLFFTMSWYCDCICCNIMLSINNDTDALLCSVPCSIANGCTTVITPSCAAVDSSIHNVYESLFLFLFAGFFSTAFAFLSLSKLFIISSGGKGQRIYVPDLPTVKGSYLVYISTCLIALLPDFAMVSSSLSLTNILLLSWSNSVQSLCFFLHFMSHCLLLGKWCILWVSKIPGDALSYVNIWLIEIVLLANLLQRAYIILF